MGSSLAHSQSLVPGPQKCSVDGGFTNEAKRTTLGLHEDKFYRQLGAVRSSKLHSLASEFALGASFSP